jgi:hypothetical protein
MLSGSALPGRFASDTPAVYSLPTGGKLKP